MVVTPNQPTQVLRIEEDKGSLKLYQNIRSLYLHSKYISSLNLLPMLLTELKMVISLKNRRGLAKDRGDNGSQGED